MHWYFPLFTISFAFSVGIQVKYDLLNRSRWFAIIFIVLWISGFFIAHKAKKEHFMLCVLVGCAIGFAYTNLYIGFVHEPLQGLKGQRARLHAVAMNYADRYEDVQRVEIRIQTDADLHLWMKSFRTIAYLPLTKDEIVPGDTLIGDFSFYSGSTNGGFDRAEYYSGRNYHILASCEDLNTLKITPSSQTPIALRPLIWAKSAKEVLDTHLGSRSATLVKGILLGDISDLTIADRQNMQKAGLSHLTAVSGMHVGYLVMFVILLFGRRVGAALALGVIVFLIPMVGPSPSVMRAVIMYAFTAAGFFFRLEYSAAHSLCAALVLLLLHNPYALFSLSLQLSFLASLGLILYGKRLQHAFLNPFQTHLNTGLKKRVGNAIASTIACSVCASVFTAPILLHTFGYVSAVSVLANLLASGMFTLAFILSILLCVFIRFSVFATVIIFLIESICAYIFAVGDVIGSWSAPLLYWENWYTKLAIFILYLAVFMVLFKKRKFSFHYATTAVCVVMVFAISLNAGAKSREHQITLFDCGSGQTIAVSQGRASLAIIDCAASGVRSAVQSIESYMDWNGFSKIDLLILTSLDQTHARNVPELLMKMQIDHIILPPNTKDSALKTQIFDIASKRKISISIWSAQGEREVGDPNLGISVLGGIPRKLGVRIAPSTTQSDMLTLHSLTPKMAATFLEYNSISCDALVISDQFLTEEALAADILNTINPQQIYMQAAWHQVQNVQGIPVRTTKEEGDINLKHQMNRGALDG